jgi:CubicO group peptidase (beta-lactamase class C family)
MGAAAGGKDIGNLSMDVSALDETIELILSRSRIPGAALAVVVGGTTVFARGYGFRDLAARLPTSAQTIYPIASTTKAMTATLLGMLVDERRLEWDAPVQEYLPGFRLGDASCSAQVTLRDLITMRTGLPRHDWLWIENAITRADLVARLRHLPLSAGFRERFQYNNVTVTAAGHIAEVVTGKSWEDLLRERILEPLGMRMSGFTPSSHGETTLSYHETARRELIPTRRLSGEVAAPSGGALHSTVEDMARWLAFNLADANIDGHALIRPETLREIHAPQVAVGADPSAPTPGAAYAMGWFVDTYNGCARTSHGGYLHDVNSDVSLFPQYSCGLVAFTNFGCASLAKLINQHAFDALRCVEPAQSLQERLDEYEQKVAECRRRNATARRVTNTAPSQSLDAYCGRYVHPGYGTVEFCRDGSELVLKRGSLLLRMQHWHYDAWIAAATDLLPIHYAHPFECASRFLFTTNADGEIDSVCVRLEPAVAAIRFEKHAAARVPS